MIGCHAVLVEQGTPVGQCWFIWQPSEFCASYYFQRFRGLNQITSNILLTTAKKENFLKKGLNSERRLNSGMMRKKVDSCYPSPHSLQNFHFKCWDRLFGRTFSTLLPHWHGLALALLVVESCVHHMSSNYPGQDITPWKYQFLCMWTKD